MTNESSFKGYDLFLDIEDKALRNRNQAIILANIAEDNTKNRLITAKGVELIFGYFHKIDDSEKMDVQARFKENMRQRGYAVA